jgi:hypothetical protein
MLSSVLTLLLTTAAANPHLTEVKAVYFLPMGAGLDQYMAIRLTEKQIFRVVTDPNLADAVFTDRIGEGLEERLLELYPDRAPKKPDMEDDEKNKNDWASQKPVRSASFSRGKGTIFLVDRRNGDIIWSLYAPAKTNRPKDLHKNAASITNKLEEALKPKPVK